jgi:predicted GNAT family acetyltransferase
MIEPKLIELQSPVDHAFESMTFPVYRHLLKLEPAPRHPEQGDKTIVRPLAIAAFQENTPIGLGLAELPTTDEKTPEMLSLFIKSDLRNQGVGTRLVERLEELIRREGFSVVNTVYTTGRPGTGAVERILEKRQWSAAEARTITLRFSPQQAASTPWFRRVQLLSDYEIFPWTELKVEEREDLKRSQNELGWIAKGLEPWHHDQHGFDPISSLGMRYRGKVVGWVINHRTGPGSVRFTCSFIWKKLGRRGRILPLFSASLERLREAGIDSCTFVTPVCYETMVAFAKKRCAPWASFVGETRGSSKVLVS